MHAPVLSPVADGISGPLDPLGHDFPDFVCLLRWELEPFVLWCLGAFVRELEPL